MKLGVHQLLNNLALYMRKFPCNQDGDCIARMGVFRSNNGCELPNLRSAGNDGSHDDDGIHEQQVSTLLLLFFHNSKSLI